MSNDLLLVDELGENDVCTDGIIFLGVWDENVLHSNVKGSVLSDDLNKTVAILPYDTEVMGQICPLSIFRRLFKEKPEALSLYNALNDTKYDIIKIRKNCL